MWRPTRIDVFTREGDTCEVFDSAVARVCVCYNVVSHVCVLTMVDSTTSTLRAMLAKKNVAILLCTYSIFWIFLR